MDRFLLFPQPTVLKPPAIPSYSRATKRAMKVPPAILTAACKSILSSMTAGRGPNINEKILAGKDSIPVEIEIIGVDYLKAPVDERFSLKQGAATWKNRSEEGQQKI